MCNCLDEIRKNIIANQKANYVRIDLSTILTKEEGKPDKENLTGQNITIGYTHVKRDGGLQPKERKTFITHDYCPFCGVKY